MSIGKKKLPLIMFICPQFSQGLTNPMPGASAFSDLASEISLGTCPWTSDISLSCNESESRFSYKLTNLILLLVMKTL